MNMGTMGCATANHHSWLLTSVYITLVTMCLFVRHWMQRTKVQHSEEQIKRGGKVLRIRGIPRRWNIFRLESLLRKCDDDIRVRSLAPEINKQTLSATVCSISATAHNLTIPSPTEGTVDFDTMSWDSGFIGMTTLFVPPEENHLVNIIALSGLGGHAYGSFKEREGDHMWLRDALPHDLVLDGTGDPIASITIFGFESTVVNSVSTQSLSDLAISLRDSLLPLVRSSPVNPLIFIAHSLGGLVVKELLSMLVESMREEDKQLAQAVYGVVFFGVPHDGMDITPLLPMIGSGPNKILVKSMCQENSRVLRTLSRKFHLALGGQNHKEVICFYETELSPTPIMTENGTWEMQGPPKILVTKESATNCLPLEDGSEHVCAIARSHSDMVKFRKNDPEYDKVCNRLSALAQRAAMHRNRQTATTNAGAIRPVAPIRLFRDLESGDYGKQLFRTTDANETFDVRGAKVGLCGWQVFWSGDGDGLCEVLREFNTIPVELEEVINQQPMSNTSSTGIL